MKTGNPVACIHTNTQLRLDKLFTRFSLQCCRQRATLARMLLGCYYHELSHSQQSFDNERRRSHSLTQPKHIGYLCYDRRRTPLLLTGNKQPTEKKYKLSIVLHSFNSWQIGLFSNVVLKQLFSREQKDTQSTRLLVCLWRCCTYMNAHVGFSWAWCCFSAEPYSYPTNYVASVYWRVSDPMVITHDRLSEIGPGQAESRDQPLLYLCLPIPSVRRTIKMERKYTELPPSLYLPSDFCFCYSKCLNFSFPDSCVQILWQKEWQPRPKVAPPVKLLYIPVGLFFPLK